MFLFSYCIVFLCFLSVDKEAFLTECVFIAFYCVRAISKYLFIVFSTVSCSFVFVCNLLALFGCILYVIICFVRFCMVQYCVFRVCLFCFVYFCRFSNPNHMKQRKGTNIKYAEDQIWHQKFLQVSLCEQSMVVELWDGLHCKTRHI